MNTITYMTGLLTFYLKGEISTDTNFLKLRIPNTILALIPLGAQKDIIPVQQVATVSTSFRLEFKKLLYGLLGVIVGLASLGSSVVFGLLLVLWGVSAVITAFITNLIITTTSGVVYGVPFLVFEKDKANQAEAMINQRIAARLQDTNVRQVTEAQTNAIVDAIANK
ncbi:hypothetical protein [Pseudobutyrivibrio sp. MD2005]|uniref:hypothetical protein n=1 Tax=Pseudobutyrivibrio sp. MD2005 TaxID=1410616 RepID=UPI00055C0863|nr:hypothetical protein [Pseudobutyrivibrio sp. MD2005]